MTIPTTIYFPSVFLLWILFSKTKYSFIFKICANSLSRKKQGGLFAKLDALISNRARWIIGAENRCNSWSFAKPFFLNFLALTCTSRCISEPGNFTKSVLLYLVKSKDPEKTSHPIYHLFAPLAFHNCTNLSRSLFFYYQSYSLTF